jgi:hypothetical protein
VTLGTDEWRMLTLIDGRRTVADLVDLTGQGEYVTCQLLGELVGKGLLETLDPAAGGRSALALMLEGREALRRLEEQELGRSPAPPRVDAPTPAPAVTPLKPQPAPPLAADLLTLDEVLSAGDEETAAPVVEAVEPAVELEADIEKSPAAPQPEPVKEVEVAATNDDSSAEAPEPAPEPAAAPEPASAPELAPVRTAAPAPVRPEPTRPEPTRPDPTRPAASGPTPRSPLVAKPAGQSTNALDRAQVARELASLGLDDDLPPARPQPSPRPASAASGEGHPGDLTRDEDVNKGLLLRLIDGVKGA